MLSPDVKYCIALINYFGMYEKSFDRATDRVLGGFIYDPISKVSPMERVGQIREALASNEMLSELGTTPTRRRSEEECRALLTQLIDRIEFYEASGLPKFQDINKLTEGDRLERLRILLQPLGEASTLSDAIKIFEAKVLPDLDGFKVLKDAVVLIRYALRFDTNKIEIQSMVTPPVTDSVLREYLRNIAWIIEDHNWNR
jgi:hypothetical protein